MALAVALAASTALAADAPPNVLLIFIDNVGYGDLGCYGNRLVKTPNIDRLARQGVRCTDFYIASPSCMPSRGALLTGRHPLRTGLNEQVWRVDDFEQSVLPPSERLIPQYLAAAGYASGCFGKWNLGFAPGSRPTERGFNEFFGHASGNIDYFTHRYNGRNDLVRGIELVEVEGYSTDLFADAACDFIRRHARRPFFVYLPFNAAHFPNPVNIEAGAKLEWQIPENYLALYGWPADEPDPKRRYLAVLTALDAAIGRVLATLDELRLAEKTLVVLASDNGAFLLPGRGLGAASNAPLRDGGTTLYEGGIRVPCIVRWPGRLPAGGICREPLTSMDLLPTFLAIAGLERPAGRTLDGYDLLDVVAGRAASRHERLGFEYGQQQALRRGRYKIIRTSRDADWQLYDLAVDIGESRDLAVERPQLVDELAAEFDAWRSACVEH